jgi:hypothetical protein
MITTQEESLMPRRYTTTFQKKMKRKKRMKLIEIIFR